MGSELVTTATRAYDIDDPVVAGALPGFADSVIGAVTNGVRDTFAAGVAPIVGPLIRIASKVWTPYDFGAIGNGVANDTPAFQSALIAAAAAGGSVEIPAGVFKLVDHAWIFPGTRAVVGAGGRFLLSGPTSCAIRTVKKGDARAEQSAATDNVDGLLIESLIIDGGGVAGVANTGIFLHGARNTVVRRNTITNIAMGSAINLLHNGAVADGDMHGIVIADNVIDIATGTKTDPNYGITVGCVLAFTAPYTDVTAQWLAIHTAAVPANPIRDIVIQNNTVRGGYYAISLSGAIKSTIRGNRCGENIRNMSIQNGSCDNVVIGNDCRDSESSGIHLAFGSSRNRIVDNVIHTIDAEGEGLLQAYLACDDNVFSGNTVSSFPAGAKTGAKHAINIAVHCNRNSVARNKIYGTYARSVVCVESAWNSTTPDVEARAHGLGSIVNGYAAAAMTANEVVDNTINTATTTTVFYIHGGNDAVNGPCALTGTRVMGNRVDSDAPAMHVKWKVDPAGSIVNSQLVNNVFPAAAMPAKFFLQSGRAFFDRILGNTVIDIHSTGSQWHGVTGATPDCSIGSRFMLADVSPVDLTNFSGRVDGDMITVRLGVNTTIKYNSALIRTKGNADILGNSNQFVTFVRAAGVWFEQWRNF